MDKASITVSKTTSIEFIIDIFKKIGPKYVVVCEKGMLSGFITKKDILIQLDGGGREHAYSLYVPLDAKEDIEEDSLSVEGGQSEVSWSRRVRKWRVQSKPSELSSAPLELHDMH
jgi:hypothetical protein